MVFLGREISERRDYSDKVAETIDAEVHDIIDAAHKSANAVISEHMPELERIAESLIEKETLEVDDLNRLWDAADAPTDDADSAPTPLPARPRRGRRRRRHSPGHGPGDARRGWRLGGAGFLGARASRPQSRARARLWRTTALGANLPMQSPSS